MHVHRGQGGHMPGLIIDLFAGGGGASTGIDAPMEKVG